MEQGQLMLGIVTGGMLMLLLLFLVREQYRCTTARRKIPVVVHVNGIRGKSSVSRLIDAGLREGGWRVFCKTTGTVPLIRDVSGQIRPVHRRGHAKIKEQVEILEAAAQDGADVLVVECMAVAPSLQKVAQHRILQAQYVVITNARLDHTEEMGATRRRIARSLAETVPRHGVLVTGEKRYVDVFRAAAEQRHTEVRVADAQHLDRRRAETIDFPENVACAVAVCAALGVEEETALRGMRSFVPDPYAVFSCVLPGGAVFINGMSANDPDSSAEVYQRERHRMDAQGTLHLESRRLVLLINNRPDRGYRAHHMVMLAKKLQPDHILIAGSYRKAMARALRMFSLSLVDRLDVSAVAAFGPDTCIFAAGNIANGGAALLDDIRQKKVTYV